MAIAKNLYGFLYDLIENERKEEVAVHHLSQTIPVEELRLLAPSIQGDAEAREREDTNFVIQNNTPRVEAILNIRHTASNTNPTVLPFKNCVNTFSKNNP